MYFAATHLDDRELPAQVGWGGRDALLASGGILLTPPEGTHQDGEVYGWCRLKLDPVFPSSDQPSRSYWRCFPYQRVEGGRLEILSSSPDLSLDRFSISRSSEGLVVVFPDAHHVLAGRILRLRAAPETPITEFWRDNTGLLATSLSSPVAVVDLLLTVLVPLWVRLGSPGLAGARRRRLLRDWRTPV